MSDFTEQSPRKIDHVISVCILRDASIWQKTATEIQKFIKSKNYSVIVPEAEIAQFQTITPVGISIINEESLLQGRGIEWVKGHLPPYLSSRAGWYYQQLLKIDFLRNLSPGEIGLVWDADTVPLTDLKFIDENGKLILRLGTHYPRIHEPYFILLERLLGIKRTHEESFISQCMPARSEWVQSFCAEFEKRRPNYDWASQILDFIKHHPSACGFSEYESLGNFFMKNFPEEIILQKGQYYRPGNFFCAPSELGTYPFDRWRNTQEYLAFDSYLNDKCTGLNIGCGNTRMTKAIDGGQCINIDKYTTIASDVSMDLEQGLPFKDGQFTHIVAHNILEHVDDLYKALEEIDRILAPGGILQIEVPHIGSYNHGTDITHRRGLTFDSFNFLISKYSYLFPSGNSPFDYNLISFNRENIINGILTREKFDEIPARGTYQDWLDAVIHFKIPGTFGFILQKNQR